MPHNVGSREHLINKNIGRVSAVGSCFAIIVGNVSRRISQSILYLNFDYNLFYHSLPWHLLPLIKDKDAQCEIEE